LILPMVKTSRIGAQVRREPWRVELLLTCAWLALLAGITVYPFLVRPPQSGELLTRNTIRLALLYYAIAAFLTCWSRPTAGSSRIQLARWCWTLAWLAYLVHLAMAFHFYHHWSHADAMAHTRAVSGVGQGIYVSHLFTVLWSADVAYWWLAPAAHAARRRWLNMALHGFMLFVIFNATVVYETGVIRWAGVALFEELGRVFLYRRAATG
jgi:hypothetical protein